MGINFRGCTTLWFLWHTLSRCQLHIMSSILWCGVLWIWIQVVWIYLVSGDRRRTFLWKWGTQCTWLVCCYSRAWWRSMQRGLPRFLPFKLLTTSYCLSRFCWFLILSKIKFIRLLPISNSAFLQNLLFKMPHSLCNPLLTSIFHYQSFFYRREFCIIYLRGCHLLLRCFMFLQYLMYRSSST